MRNEEGRRKRNTEMKYAHFSTLVEKESRLAERERHTGRMVEEKREVERESGPDSENDRQSTMTVHEG